MKELLRVRLSSAKSSVTKYKALLAATCADGRLRGTLQFRGASRTGRYAGRLFQPQNLARQTLSLKELDFATEAALDGTLPLFYPDKVPEILSEIYVALSPSKTATAWWWPTTRTSKVVCLLGLRVNSGS